MTISTVYKAAEACALARIDNKRFNEAVAKNFYPCAPAAQRGSPRKFTEDDVVALFVYARLLDQDIPQRVAGLVACKVRSKIEEDPMAGEVRVLKSEEKSEEDNGVKSDTPKVEYSAHVYWVFDVGGIRKYVRAASSNAQAGKDE